MKTDLSIDLASSQTLKELRMEAKEIMDEVNEIIEASDPKEIPECVQWRNSRCLFVAFVLEDVAGQRPGRYCWSCVISKPSGPFGQLADYLYRHLSDRRGTDIVLSCYE